MDETREMANSSTKSPKIVDETGKMADSSTKSTKIVDEHGCYEIPE
ncbi:MAG: hypothetical protein J6W09_01720 [Bacteroidales bacterium]|nr:hypothetical protein [Bacteroidales bacterium]